MISEIDQKIVNTSKSSDQVLLVIYGATNKKPKLFWFDKVLDNVTHKELMIRFTRINTLNSYMLTKI